MDLNVETRKLLEEIGPGRMSSTAYDTAWVARLVDYDRELSNNALSWLCENQLPDGSWGAAEPFYYHDRVISTLAAMIALTHRGRRAQDRVQIDKGLLALERITSGATSGLAADPNGATVGFEMIVPTLVAEAERLGIVKQQGDRILGRLRRLRDAKMAKLQGLKINRYITPAFSAEMAGEDGQSILDIDNLQENDGSVAHSPSATAYFALKLKPGDPKAMEYLRAWAAHDGGAPNYAPIDNFEIAWSLWNLYFANSPDNSNPEIKRLLDTLQGSWHTGTGIGTAVDCTVKDSDDSSVAFEVLCSFGYAPDVEAILSYEEDNHYRCFSLEANPSISANIHVLGALKKAGFVGSDKSIKKILKFLHQTRTNETYWYDKWHTSPFYATTHAIIASVSFDKNLCSNAVQWILENQRADGSWGHFSQATAEETAYCLQALLTWEQSYGKVPRTKLELGARWLTEHFDDSYHPLWIGKALYTPYLVVKSAILGALDLTNKVTQ
ncbi:MAG: cyclase [Chloroflexota bacterium]